MHVYTALLMCMLVCAYTEGYFTYAVVIIFITGLSLWQVMFNYLKLHLQSTTPLPQFTVPH
jgi:hypothetical protein